MTCLATTGHTWGHICLYKPHHNILFSGVHFLGDITPNVQAWSLDDDPLQSYMESLDKTVSLDMILYLIVERHERFQPMTSLNKVN